MQAPTRFTSGLDHATNCTGGVLGLRGGIDVLEMERNSCPYRN